MTASPRSALADGFITRLGTVGILDVPTAETLGLGGGRLGFDVYAERTSTGAMRVAGLPLTLVTGLPLNLDLGLALRDSGLPGDPEPALPLLTVTAKVGIFKARGWRPGLAVAASFDRINWRVETSLRAVASSGSLGPLRLSAFAGASVTELNLSMLGPIGGLAVLVRLPADVELAAEGLRATTGWLLGGGVRWTPWKHLGLSASVTWKPGDLAPRTSLGLTILVGEVSVEASPEEAVPDTVKARLPIAPSGPTQYADPKPRFRLKLRSSAHGETVVPRHLQYEPEPDARSPPADASAVEDLPRLSPTP